jgi:NAD-dependent oxidoreductase involved in siderophore biosynthesis
MTIDRAKITVTKRSFFRTAEVMSIRIEDVLNVACSVGLLFGSITLISRVMNSDQTVSVGHFWRHDAQRLKWIGQGYVIALQRNIDCSALEAGELAAMLEKLGADNHPTV